MLYVICFLVASIWAYRKIKDDDVVINLMISIIVGFLGLLVGFLVNIFLLAIFSKAEDTSYTAAIYSLGNKSDIKGSFGGFIIGTGHIGEELNYYYYSDGAYGKKIFSSPNNSTYLVEDANSRPYVEVFYTKYTCNIPSWFMPNRMEDGRKRYVLHVPEGTIRMRYSVGTDGL